MRLPPGLLGSRVHEDQGLALSSRCFTSSTGIFSIAASLAKGIPLDLPSVAGAGIMAGSASASMNATTAPADSWLWLSADVLSARVLVWVASVGRNAELTPEAHSFFFDRYQRLAQYHRVRGRVGQAQRLQAKADEHYHTAGGGGDGPPYAAAMAMPRPARFIRTDAVSGHRPSDYDDAA